MLRMAAQGFGRLVVILVAALAALSAEAGQLILRNTSAAPITCTVDGWTVASGASFDWYIQVQPGQPFSVGQNYSRPGPPIINWANCPGLQTQAMAITPAGPNGTLVLNGQQTRVLNVSLYPYIPKVTGTTFESLVNYVIQTYQQQNPQVLLNAVMNENVDIYSYGGLQALLGNQGFNVIELDTLYLGFLASQNLINPAQIAGDQPLAVATAASTYNGQLWGVPSWLCTDFVYSANAQLAQVASFNALIQFLGQMPTTMPKLVGNYNGSWRLPSMYINGYVQIYGYNNINQALQMPPNQTVINNLITLTDTCLFSNVNNCTNNFYHNQPNGTSEQVFATAHASDDMGFSEQSFYIFGSGFNAALYAVVTPWGPNPQPLLYSDTFVTSRATCPTGSQCFSDATALTTLMTGVAMKNYIVKSQDLQAGMPWRTLLVATQPFYQQPEIMNNAMYQQYTRIFAAAQPFPNAFTEQLQNAMKTQICSALQAQRPNYVCTPVTQTGRVESRQ